jgi:SAM-dependent methyltransferase
LADLNCEINRLDKAEQKQWDEALLLSGESVLRVSLMRELTEYTGLTVRQIENHYAERLKKASDEWFRIPRKSDRRVQSFYNDYFDYIFEEISLDNLYRRLDSCFETLKWLNPVGELNILDYGSGIGNMALFYCAQGFHVTLADVSTSMLDFCRWRFAQRGWSASFIDLKKQKPPIEAYDAIISIDVFEHLHDPWKHLQILSKAVKPAGTLFIEGHFGYDDDRPMHIIKDSRVLDLAPFLKLQAMNCSPYHIRLQPAFLVFRKNQQLWGSLSFFAVLVGLIRYGLKFFKNGRARLS